METTISSETGGVKAHHHDEDGYGRLLVALRERALAATGAGAALFQTDAAPRLFDAFLGALDEPERQHYNCRACRRFVERYGGLVTVADDGLLVPLFWAPAGVGAGLDRAVEELQRMVRRATISSVFFTSERTWGVPQNESKRGTWRHMSAVTSVLVGSAERADQLAAQKSEEFGMLCRGLAEFPAETVRAALQLLVSGNLYRSEKCEGMARWLLDLHEARALVPGSTLTFVPGRVPGAAHGGDRAANLTWRAVAKAPTGFCHVRSGMIGALLEDVKAGLPFEVIKERFYSKMNPLLYQRPQAAPSAGNIAAAEKLVAEMGIAPSLSRRFAKLEEVQALWRPSHGHAPKSPHPGSVFGHLAAKGRGAVATSVRQPPTPITWEKFRRTVLPDAKKIELLAPFAGSYAALLTAADSGAPPILQWDNPEQRNPFSWYVYASGSHASRWNLRPGGWVAVAAVALGPNMWSGEDRHAHHGQRVFLLLEGARDLNYAAGRGGGLFPEMLKSEFHQVRATLEAYSRQAAIAGKEEATACGLLLRRDGEGWDCTLRVTGELGEMFYQLDRWD